jgi:hypothetical protein
VLVREKDISASGAQDLWDSSEGSCGALRGGRLVTGRRAGADARPGNIEGDWELTRSVEIPCDYRSSHWDTAGQYRRGFHYLLANWRTRPDLPPATDVRRMALPVACGWTRARRSTGKSRLMDLGSITGTSKKAGSCSSTTISPIVTVYVPSHSHIDIVVDVPEYCSGANVAAAVMAMLPQKAVAAAITLCGGRPRLAG